MTLTFNPETYGSLLAEYKPKAIKTDEENEQAIAIAEELSHRHNRTAEEDELLYLLIALIEKYEEDYYPMGESTPHSMLLHLMEAGELKEEDLIDAIGSREKTEAIASGTREISIEDARALGKFFNLAPELFVK